MAQLDDGVQPRIGTHDGGDRSQCDLVHLRAHKTPTVFGVTQQRVDAVGTHPDIQRTHRGAPGNNALIRLGQEVGEAMQIVGAARDRRTQIARGNVPVRHAVLDLQQRAIQSAHGVWIAEIQTGVAGWGGEQEVCQLRARRRQQREVVTTLVPVARMQPCRRFAHEAGITPPRRGVAGPNQAARNGRCSHRASAPDNPGAPARPPRNRRRVSPR